jgi:histidinol-phosphatase
MRSVDSDLAFALELADAADDITLSRFRAHFDVHDKEDGTIVTDVDRATEAELRRRITAARPTERVLGEEYGEESREAAAAFWIIDPIDGTTNYARGVPIWATLIALMRAGQLVASVASAPALGRRWWAARGRGAFVDGTPLRVSEVDSIERAAWSFLSVRSFVRLGLLDGLLELSQRAHSTRGLGDFWQHMLVAEGALDFAVDTMLHVWDFAAVKLIVEEAGGRFTNLAGKAPADSNACLSSNGRLHDEVLRVLRPRAPGR